MHKHNHENEISYVFEGELSVIQIGEMQTTLNEEYFLKPRSKSRYLYSNNLL